MLRSERKSAAKPAWSGAIAPARYQPAVARGRISPGKAVGAFVPGLTRKAFENFGFSTASLIMDWQRIAGSDVAQWTAPERVVWPRGVEAPELAEETGNRRGATLVLRVDPARALDVDYRSRQIVERINAYFGYRAVTELRILQAPLTSRSAAPAAKTAARAPARAEAPAGELLADALARMAAGVKAASRPR
jgi:hypothetical protein